MEKFPGPASIGPFPAGAVVQDIRPVGVGTATGRIIIHNVDDKADIHRAEVDILSDQLVISAPGMETLSISVSAVAALVD